MFTVTVENLWFEIWANQLKTGAPIVEMLSRIADYTVASMSGEMDFSGRATGKTEHAMKQRTSVTRSGNTFSVGVGSLEEIGVTPESTAPAGTIMSFYEWYSKKLTKVARKEKWYYKGE